VYLSVECVLVCVSHQCNMDRGCSGDDGIPPDGGRLPGEDRSGKKKGKGRAKTPPPREKTPEPEPEPDRLAHGNVPGRNPEMVAWEQFEAGPRASRSKTAAAAKIRREECFKLFSGIPLEVFAFVLNFLPFSNLLMCLRVCRTYRAFVDDDRLSNGIWESFKFTFKFVNDFTNFLFNFEGIMSKRWRFKALWTHYSDYFGDGTISRRNTMINFKTLFPSMRKRLKVDVGVIDGFLKRWLLLSFGPNRDPDTFDTVFPGIPLSSIWTLRSAGIFSTLRTRRAFIRGLDNLMSSSEFEEPRYSRFRIMLDFLCQLTTESFSFRGLPVNSHRFCENGRITELVNVRTATFLVDISQNDFSQLVIRYRALYGNEFLGMRYMFPH
jgi:hypothetical protein